MQWWHRHSLWPLLSLRWCRPYLDGGTRRPVLRWRCAQRRRGHLSRFELRGATPCVRRQKKLYIGERFVDCRQLVPLPTISCKNACVENELVRIIDYLFGGVRRGASVSIRDCVIDLMPDNINGVGGGVCLAELIVVRETFSIGDNGVGFVEVGEKIHLAGSAIPSVRPVFYPHKVVLNSAQKFLTKGAVYVSKGVEQKHGRIIIVVDGR